MNRKEKSGVEVLVIGKRIIVFDQNANKIATVRMNGYTWEVKP